MVSTGPARPGNPGALAPSAWRTTAGGGVKAWGHAPSIPELCLRGKGGEVLEKDIHHRWFPVPAEKSLSMGSEFSVFQTGESFYDVS